MLIKEEVVRRIQETTKPLQIRHGFAWKGACWCSTTKEKLIQTVQSGFYAHYDIFDNKEFFGISFYSESDMM